MAFFRWVVAILISIQAIALPAHAGINLFEQGRAQLGERGLTFEALTTQDYVSVINGGLIRKDSWVGLTELMLTWETAKSGLWQGGKFFVHGTSTNGHLKPTGELTGDVQAVNNNEAPRSVRLYEAWYEHALMDGEISLLTGLHDINSEFVVSNAAGLYLNGAFGITPCITSNVPTSAYPLAALAARIKWTPNEEWDFLAAVYDGDPGSSTVNTHSTHLAVKSQDGLLAIAEAGRYYHVHTYGTPLPGTLKAGAWHSSRNAADVSSVDENGNAVPYDDNYGAYAMVEQMLWQEKEGQGLTVFFIGAGAPQNRNTLDRHIAAGVNYTGLIPGRDVDSLGLAFTNASFSNKARAANGKKRAETAIEGTYRVELNKHMALQPDIQYVINPNGDPAIKNATVLTIRTEISF